LGREKDKRGVRSPKGGIREGQEAVIIKTGREKVKVAGEFGWIENRCRHEEGMVCWVKQALV